MASRNTLTNVPNIPEFEAKLLQVSQSLSRIDLPAVAFLCQAVCPKACIYHRNITDVPSVPQCYDGLCRHDTTELVAVSLILHVLRLVGVKTSDVDDLQRIANENRIETGCADPSKLKVYLPPDSLKSLQFRELLCTIYRHLPQDDRTALIGLTCSLLNPPRYPTYTRSLLVHFMTMIQCQVIFPDHVQPLHDCLLIIGDKEALEHVKTYCKEQGLNILHDRRIERRNATMEAVSSPSRYAHSVMETTNEQTPLLPRPIPGNKEPHSPDSNDLEEGQVVLSASIQESQTMSDRDMLVVSYKSGRSRRSTGGEPIHSTPNPPPVEFLEVKRVSRSLAYVKWKHPDADPDNYTIEIKSRAGVGGETERSAAVAAQCVLTETNEFVAARLESCKEYIVTVQAKSARGGILASGVHSIPLPTDEIVPVPHGVRVTPLSRTSLRVNWERVRAPALAEGYTVVYYTSAGAERQMKAVNATRSTHTTLEGLQPNVEYTIQVAVRMPGNVLGEFSDLQIGTPRTSARRHLSHVLCSVSVVCLPLALVLLVVSSAVLGKYSRIPTLTKDFEIFAGDMIELGDTDIHLYDLVSFSAEKPAAINYSLFYTSCKRVATSPNSSFSGLNSYIPGNLKPRWVEPEGSRGYFARKSTLVFQLSAFGPVFLSNCSAALYLFDSASDLDDFIYNNSHPKANHLLCICINVSNTTSNSKETPEESSTYHTGRSIYNQQKCVNSTPYTYHINGSTYIYIGLFIVGVTNVTYNISGTQYIYNASNYNKSCDHTNCTVSIDKPLCSLEEDCDVCSLAYMHKNSDSDTPEKVTYVTHKASYDITVSFPHNLYQLVFLATGCVAITLVCVAICFCAFYVHASNCYK